LPPYLTCYIKNLNFGKLSSHLNLPNNRRQQFKLKIQVQANKVQAQANKVEEVDKIKILPTNEVGNFRVGVREWAKDRVEETFVVANNFPHNEEVIN